MCVDFGIEQERSKIQTSWLRNRPPNHTPWRQCRVNRTSRLDPSNFLRGYISSFLSVFQFTAPSSPERHRQALAIFSSTTIADPSIARIPDKELGAHLYESIASFLDSLGVPRGLKAVG